MNMPIGIITTVYPIVMSRVFKGENSRCIRALNGHFKKAIREPNEWIKFSMDSTNLQRWYIMIHDIPSDDGVFDGGEYIVEMTAPDKFPDKPPSFKFLTPNGVYKLETAPCISIGQYHSDAYPAALGMSGFAKEICNGLICYNELGHGIALIKTTNEEKKRLAARSVAYNLENHKEIVEAINSQFAEYSAAWVKPVADATVPTVTPTAVLPPDATSPTD